MDNASFNTANKIEPLEEQIYDRYLPSGFNNNFSILQKLNLSVAKANEVVDLINTLTDMTNGHSTGLTDVNQNISDLWDELKRIVLTQKQDVIQKSNDLYSNFIKKMRDKQAVKIVCRGDSITYGSDFASGDKRSATGSADDGTAHVATRASTTYPEALSTYLNQVNGNNVTVINQGYSGDGVKDGYNHWNEVAGADVVIISYGINDAGNSEVEYMGDVVEFLKWYRLMIERALNNNSAVILMSPFKQRIVATNNDASRTDVDVFGGAVKMLASEYNLPLINGQEIFKNYSASLYSDYTHPNGTGYNTLGARIAGALIGKGVSQPFKVNGQSVQGVISFTEGTVYKGGYWAHSDYYPTAEENEVGYGTGAVIGAGEKLYFPFYAENDNMIVVPSMFSSNAGLQVKVSLDFGVQNADYSNSYDFGRVAISNTDLAKPVSSFVLNQPQFNGSGGIHAGSFIKALSDVGLLFIPYKGFHMVCVEILSDSTGGTLTVHGLEFYDAGRLGGENAQKQQALTLVNGVTHYYSSDPAQVQKDDKGWVVISGTINTIPATPRPLLLTTLPLEYAPKSNKPFNVALSSSTTGGYANISVQTNGEVYLNYMSTVAAFCTLNGITYPTK